MKTEIYECDRCRKKATTKEERELLGLGDIHLGFRVDYACSCSVWAATSAWHKQWCRACRAELGCQEEKISDRKNPTPDNQVPSLEDMVREIVRQEILP